MADFKILCPACTSVLSSKKPIPNGKKITCPHCKRLFVAATSEICSSSDSSSLDFEFSPPAPAATIAKSPSTSQSSVRLPAKAAAKPGSRRVVLWTVLVGFVVLIGAGTGLGVYYVMKTADDTPTFSKSKSKKSNDGKADPKAAVAQNKSAGDARKDEKAARGQEKSGAGKKNPKSVANNLQTVAAGNADLTQTTVAAPAPPKAAKAAKPPEWKEFTSPKGGFAVQFPGDPEQLTEREEDVIYYDAKAEVSGTDYLVTFHRLKKDELAMPAKDRLNAIAEQFKDGMEEKKEVAFGGQPAMSLQMLLGDKKIRAFERWLVHKEHVFQISVSGDRDKLGPDQVNRFLDSFRFVADPQGEFVDLTKLSGLPPERKKK